MRKVVFIIGAGASKAYRYPDGFELVGEICDLFDETNTNTATGRKYVIQSYMREAGVVEANYFQRFRDKLFYSEVYSIDAFLKLNNEFEKIGKLAIAYCLLQHENDWHIFAKDKEINKDHWYRKLFNELINFTDLRTLKGNEITFITFNYDLSLEFYLYSKLKNLFDYTEREIVAIIEKLNIIHIHGQLGYLSFQEPGGRTYSKNLFPDSLLPTASKINIAYETLDQREQHGILARAHQALNNAWRIFFLGFSYHPDNMELLKIKELSRDYKMLCGTGLGLSANELRLIQDQNGIVPYLEKRLSIMELLSQVPIFEKGN